MRAAAGHNGHSAPATENNRLARARLRSASSWPPDVFIIHHIGRRRVAEAGRLAQWAAAWQHVHARPHTHRANKCAAASLRSPLSAAKTSACGWMAAGAIWMVNHIWPNWAHISPPRQTSPACGESRPIAWLAHRRPMIYLAGFARSPAGLAGPRAAFRSAAECRRLFGAGVCLLSSAVGAHVTIGGPAEARECAAAESQHPG